MRAGRLRHRITVERATDQADEVGGRVRTWSPVAGLTDIHARVISESDREQLIERTMQGVRSYRIEVRAEITASLQDRIDWHGVKLAIRSITESEDGRVRLLYCDDWGDA